MLGKCVHYVSGIEVKQIVKVDHHNGFDFYMLRKDYETKNGFMKIYFEYNNHYFPISSNVEHIKQYLNENPNFNILEMITAEFEESLKSGARVSKGYAQFLGREQEAQEAVSRFKEQRESERKQKELEAEEKRKQELQKLEESITAAEKEYINNKRINDEMFIALCDRHNVKIPIRTRGWIKESLFEISFSETGYTSYKYSGNKSNSIGNIARELYNTIKESKQEINNEEYVTLDELNHLFGA